MQRLGEFVDKLLSQFINNVPATVKILHIHTAYLCQPHFVNRVLITAELETIH